VEARTSFFIVPTKSICSQGFCTAQKRGLRYAVVIDSVDRKTEKIMSQHQAAIVQDLPLHAVYLSFDLQESASQARYAGFAAITNTR
jgi:hypothetical protein